MNQISRNVWAFSILVMISADGTLAQQLETKGWCNRPESTVCPCNCNSLIEVPEPGLLGIPFNKAMAFDLFLQGSMTLEKVGETDVDGTCDAQFGATVFNASGFHPILGNIEVMLDTSRPAPAGSLINTVPHQHFPATHGVFAHTFVKFSSFPGLTLRSTQPFHMSSNSINTFSPAESEVYTLVSPVDLEDIENPGTTIAILTEAQIIVGATLIPTVSRTGLIIMLLFMMAMGALLVRARAPKFSK